MVEFGRVQKGSVVFCSADRSSYFISYTRLWQCGAMICLARNSCAWTYVCACPRLGSGPFRCLWWMFLIDRQRSSVPYTTFSLTFTHIWLKLSSVHSISNTCRSPPRSLNRLALSSSGSLHTFTPQLFKPKACAEGAGLIAGPWIHKRDKEEEMIY